MTDETPATQPAEAVRRLSNHERQIMAAERQLKAFRLREAGASYEQIGQQLGIHKATVWRMVDKFLAKMHQEPIKHLLKLELARLDEISTRLWPKVLQGNYEAISYLLRIMERRARYCGLDAPVKVAPTTPDGETALPSAVVFYLPSNDRDAAPVIDGEATIVKALPPGNGNGNGNGNGDGHD